MESAAVFALHQWAVSQAWAADLALALAQYGVVLLPLAAVALWTRNDHSRDGRRTAILVGVVAAILRFALGLVLERTLHRLRPSWSLASNPWCHMRLIRRFPATTPWWGSLRRAAAVADAAIRRCIAGLGAAGGAGAGRRRAAPSVRYRRQRAPGAAPGCRGSGSPCDPRSRASGSIDGFQDWFCFRRLVQPISAVVRPSPKASSK